MTDTKAPRGAITARIIDIMKAMKDSPMSETCARIAKDCEMTVSYARAWYINLVKRDKAPGVVEKSPKKVKPAKAPKTPKVKVAKAPADRKAALKKAAKKAGIHKDSVAEATNVPVENDDTLGLAAPDSLSLDDLKSVV